MKNKKNFKHITFVLTVFLLPFTDFLKGNINEINLILGKSFYFLVFVLFLSLLLLTYTVNFFLRKKDFFKTLLIITVIYWLAFKHNLLNLIIKSLFDKFFLIGSEYSSETSLLILIVLSIYTSILIYKNNLFFKKFIFVFFYLTLFVSLFQIFTSNQKSNIDEIDKMDIVNFPDKLSNKKENIYFFILDGMQPIKEFEKYYKLNEKNFVNYVENKNYKYIHNTTNIYDNTTHSLSAFFYLDRIFDENNKLKKKSKILYPTLLRKNNKPDLLNNLDNLGYDFKWLGNFFAFCPKFNLKYCLNKNVNTVIDTYLYLNFFRQSPLIQTVMSLGYIFNFDFDRHIYFDVNDGMGRLTNYLSESDKIDKPTFYFIHHMSPHWPYITNEDCSYKNYPGNKNFEGYKSAYICTLKKIKETIKFLNEFDPNSTVVFQSDHNWVMSKNEQEKKMIFNLIKINDNCNVVSDINLNNVNALRLIFSCMTGSDPRYIKK
tara:strand:+ start:428 stop:1888 length:1461 start_codon:yes stop_codon:yes gene_type:complete